MNAPQFLRLADRLQSLPAEVRATVEQLAAGDSRGAEKAAGGKGSETWWAAEFFLAQLRDHGIDTARPSARPAPRTASLFAD